MVERCGTGYWVAATVLLAALPLHRLIAQCPDGSPPPCAGPRPPDPNRIAILPFHVTTADTLLGEGLAELLATSFTGESGPRAVHMGTVLRAWRHAGGNLRTPLGQPQALRLAREIDAGRYVEGSVVGLGSRLTLSASLVATADGVARNVGPVSGPADSLQSLVGQLASSLLGAAGREGIGVATRLTDSPAAMRAYLAGLAFYRRSQFTPAAGAFERALALDPSFGRATLLRYIAAGWMDAGDVDDWARRTWEHRARLSVEDGVLVTALLGDHYPELRSPAASLADRVAAVRLLPESPEAHYVLADYLYHSGAANGLDPFTEARKEFERSLALDNQATVLQHLIEIGLYTGDTNRLRRYWPMYDRLESGPHSTAYGIVIAELTGDSGLAATMSKRYQQLDYLALQMASRAAGVSVDAVAQRYDRLIPAADDAERAQRDYMHALSLLALGHPSAVRAIRDGARDSVLVVTLDRLLLLDAVVGGGPVDQAERAVARLQTVTNSDSATFPGAMCARALWGATAGTGPSFDMGFLQRNHWSVCAAAVDVVRAQHAAAPELDAKLSALDSLLRWDIANTRLESHDFEHLILAHAWESRGEHARALAAVQLHFNGFGVVGGSQAATAREEGRLATAVGDTTRAIRAYHRYLRLRRDPDPVLIPQRDSVAAELVRLERR